MSLNVDLKKKNLFFSILGINITMATMTDRYVPMHWHDTIEVLYCLNGEIEVTIDRKKYLLSHRQLIVIDSGRNHSIQIRSEKFMFLGLQISRDQMRTYEPAMDAYRIECVPAGTDETGFEQYLELCRIAEELVNICFADKRRGPLMLEADGKALILFSRLLEHFSERVDPDAEKVRTDTNYRIHQILSYVSMHYREPIGLSDMTEQFGLTRDYFCHFFKKQMGLSFLEYVNRVRISNAYQDLILTGRPVGEIMESNGFTNQKIFNRTFREIYGCTPREARARHRQYEEREAAAADKTERRGNGIQ